VRQEAQECPKKFADCSGDVLHKKQLDHAMVDQHIVYANLTENDIGQTTLTHSKTPPLEL